MHWDRASRVIKLQWEALLNACVKPLIPTNLAQLFNLFKAGHLNADNGKKQQKMAHVHQRK